MFSLTDWGRSSFGNKTSLAKKGLKLRFIINFYFSFSILRFLLIFCFGFPFSTQEPFFLLCQPNSVLFQ